MDKGWISIHRKIQDHWLFKDKREFSKFEAWIDILLNVNHSDQKVNIKNAIILVKRGESIRSLDTWAKRWNWNKSKVRRFLNLLKSDTMVVLKPTHQTTHLTVLNYESYQGERNADETQVKRKRNAGESQLTPNNNVNNENNENNELIIKATDRELQFKESLYPYVDEYSKATVKAFFEYWSERGDNDAKMRFEKERTFSTKARLIRWKKNEANFNRGIGYNNQSKPTVGGLAI